MDFIEWMLAGFGVKSLQRPLVFVSMGIATLFFGGLAAGSLILALIDVGRGGSSASLIGVWMIVIPFSGLAYLSARMAKKCFDPKKDQF